MWTKDLLDLQRERREAKLPYVLATVVEISGSSSARPGAKALIDRSGQLACGWVGGGCAHGMVAEAALACLDSGEPRVIDIDLTDEVFGAGMPCGGTMRVYVEPVLPKPFAWLVGQGLILECLCDFAHRLGFDAVVTDSNASPEQFPRAYRVVRDDRRYLLLQPGRGDFVVVATHHKGDHAALARALNSEAAYVALVSSRKRAALVLQRLKREGFGDEVLARVRAPAGLDLGAKLPEEIALAIAAEMVLVRRGGKGQPMRELPRETATV